MNSTFYAALLDGNGIGVITHIGLKNSGGTEISGGSYARQPVTWTGAGATRNLSADEAFNIPAGAQVQSWCGFSALTGGTDYGGEDLDTPSAVYGNAGTFILDADSTSVTLQAGA